MATDALDSGQEAATVGMRRLVFIPPPTHKIQNRLHSIHMDPRPCRLWGMVREARNDGGSTLSGPTPPEKGGC